MRGFAQVVILVLSLVGIIATVYLIQQKTHFLSQAYSGDQMLQMFSNLSNPSLATNQTQAFSFASTTPSQIITGTVSSSSSDNSISNTPFILGNNQSPSSSESYNQNMINGSQFKTSSTQTFATSMSIYLANYDGASPQIQMAIYKDINGSPGSLIWNSGDIISGQKGWITTSVPSIPLTSNTTYWLMFNTHGKSSVAEVNKNEGISWNSGFVKYGTWPQHAGSGNFSRKEYFIYLNLSNQTPLPSSTPTQTPYPTAIPTTEPTSTPTTIPTLPPISNALLGFNGIPTITDTGDLNSLDGGQFMMGNQSGSAISMSIYIKQVDSTNPGVQLGIYTDNYGKPQNLIWHSNTFNVTTGWNSEMITQPVSLAANTPYWLLFNVNGSGTEAGWDSQSGNGWYSGDSNVPFGSWDNSISYNGNTDNQLYAIYVKYSPTNSIPTPTPATITSNSGSSFVNNCNGQFCVNGISKKFVGVNFYGLLGNCGPSANGNYNSVMQTLSQSGIRLIRFWLFQPMGVSSADLQNALDAAKSYGIYLLPTFGNHWSNGCDGSSKDDNWYGGGYMSSYKPYVLSIVQQFKNNPNIFGWMLMNEAEDGTNPANLYNFTQDMSTSIRSIDPNHLITLGTIGRGQGGTTVSSGEYQSIYGLPNIGFLDAHDYDNPNISYPDIPNGDGIASDVQVSKNLGKPMLIGEEGMSPYQPPNIDPNSRSCNGGGYSGSYSQRASYTQNKISQAFSHGVSGYILWMFDLNGGGDGCEFSPGDPLMNVLKSCSIGSC